MIFSPFERAIAFRYLRARREEGFVSVIASFSLVGIALGVAALIIVMSVMNGFRGQLLGRILGVKGHVEVFAPNRAPLKDFDGLAERIERIPGILRVTPTVEGQVMASANGVASGALVRGMRKSDVEGHAVIANNIKAGSLDGFANRGEVLVGSHFARRFGLSPGSRLTLISAQTNPEGFGLYPRTRTVRVGGVFQVGMYQFDYAYILMPLQSAQQYFGTGDAVISLEVLTDDPEKADQVVGAIKKWGDRPLDVRSWKTINKSVYDALNVERSVMFVILTLIILVAAFNIVSGMIMLVKDKGRDIAILRTMGATRGMIMRIFMLAGASIGVVGTAAGFAVGLALSLNIEPVGAWIEDNSGDVLLPPVIRFLARMPSDVHSWEVVSVVAMALGLSFLSTVYPAWRAARLDPVEALRYE